MRCRYRLKFGKPPTLTCSKYKKDTSSCTIHFIRCKDLYDFVLYDIKRQSNLILKDEKKAAEKLKKKMCSTNKATLERSERDAKATEKRIKELDERFYHLYEDKLNGVLSEERCIELSRRCETELEEQKAKLERIRSIKLESAEADENIENYIALIKEFKDINELDKAVLHRLIDKITVSTKYEVDGVKKQDIKISYKFVGNVG